MKIVERAINELLKAYASGKVYVGAAPKGVQPPFIVFQATTGMRWRSLRGPSGMAQTHMQIDVYGADFYSAKDLAAQIETTLDGYRGTVSYGTNSPRDTITIAGISLQDENDTVDRKDEPLLFRSLKTYLITYQQ